MPKQSLKANSCKLPFSDPRPLEQQSQSLSRSYGSVLPTSLTYIVLFDQRLFTLETCCGYGYGLGREYCPPHHEIFKGPHEWSGLHQSCAALRQLYPFLWVNQFQGLACLQRKDNSSRDSRRHLPWCLRYRQRLAHEVPPTPPQGSGILTWFPFALTMCKSVWTSPSCHISSGFRLPA
jgi:hypothetical protein